eukprot:5765910-Pleurochrysis_carterae.AAC.5
MGGSSCRETSRPRPRGGARCRADRREDPRPRGVKALLRFWFAVHWERYSSLFVHGRDRDWRVRHLDQAH